MVALASEPQSVGRVLDSGFKLFVKAFAGVLPLSLAAAAVLAVPNIANVLMGGTEQVQSAVPATTAVVVLFLVALPIYMILIAAVVYRLGAVAELHKASRRTGAVTRCPLRAPAHRRSPASTSWRWPAV